VEPPAGSRGRAPGRGRSPPEAETLFASECSMETASSLIFSEIWKRKRPSNIVEFCNSCWKMAKKRTFSYKVACKKFSWSGQRGGHRTVALPLNTPLRTTTRRCGAPSSHCSRMRPRRRRHCCRMHVASRRQSISRCPPRFCSVNCTPSVQHDVMARRR